MANAMQAEVVGRASMVAPLPGGGGEYGNGILLKHKLTNEGGEKAVGYNTHHAALISHLSSLISYA